MYFYHQLITIVLVLMLVLSVKTQELDSNQGIISVQTDITQIAVSITDKNKINPRWELFLNTSQITDYALDSPQNAPLRLVILILQTDKNSRDFRIRSNKINKRLQTIEKDLGLTAPPLVVSYRPEESQETIKYPTSWNAFKSTTIASAIDRSVETLQGVGSGSRRALLIISDATQGLPMDILEKTDVRLLNRSALVFYMGVTINKEGANRKRVVALSNIQGGKMTVFGGDYIDSLFSYFNAIANNLYVLSFQNDEDFASCEVKVFAYNSKNELVGQNERVVKILTATATINEKEENEK